MSRNICNLCHKVGNNQNLPHEIPIFRNYFILSNFTANLVNFSTSLRPDYRTFLPKLCFFLFSTLNWRMFRIMCHKITNHKMCNGKTSVGPTFTWSIEACLIYVFITFITSFMWERLNFHKTKRYLAQQY